MISRDEENLKTLRAVPVVLSTLVRGLDVDHARRRPADGEWAVVEVVAHMRDVEDHALRRVTRMVEEDAPALDAFDHEQLAIDDDYISQDLDEVLDAYLDLRRRHLDIVGDLDPSVWGRTGVHGEHGEMTVSLFESHVAAEDVDHLAQIARLLTL